MRFKISLKKKKEGIFWPEEESGRGMSSTDLGFMLRRRNGGEELWDLYPQPLGRGRTALAYFNRGVREKSYLNGRLFRWYGAGAVAGGFLSSVDRPQ